MSEKNCCPECGAALPTNSPQGLCPGCLLKWGLESQSGGGEGESQPAAADYTPPTPEELAAHFPDLEILEFVGRGGMGVVYKARQKSLDRFVALKILAPKVGQAPAFSERFAREARAMAMLSHPNVVAVYDFGQTDGLYYFLMEYVDGINLHRLLETGKLAPEQALAIVPQICEALQYAHDHGVVHRDIKPGNLLLDREGRVKIADFGLAKLVGREARGLTLTGSGHVMGTPQYMAPEQIERPLQVDHRADIYSLGVVFYQMLTGELPLGRFAPPSRKVHIDVRLDEVVLRALEKEPERRYQQASEIKSQVESIVQTEPRISSDVVPSDVREWARRFRRRWMTPVGTRDGQRVIHWPAVFFTSTGIAGGILGLFLLPDTFQTLLGRTPEPRPGLLLVVELISVALAAIAMRSFIRWKLKMPIDQLPSLDEPPPRDNAGETPVSNSPSEASMGQVSAFADHKASRWSWRAVPWQIWVVVVLLGLEGLGNLAALSSQPRAIDWLLTKCLLIVGLLRGWKWVFVLELILGAIHVVGFLSAAPLVAMANLLLVGLTCSAYRYYFPRPAKALSPGQGVAWRSVARSAAVIIVLNALALVLPNLLYQSLWLSHDFGGQSRTAVAEALEEYRQTVVGYDLGFDSVFPQNKWTHYDAARLKAYPTKDAWPQVLGHVDTNPNAFNVVRNDSRYPYDSITGPNAFMVPLDRALVAADSAYATLLFLKGISPKGTVVAKTYASVVCIGPMKGRLDFDSYTSVLVKGDVSGRITSQSYFNLVVTGKFSGRIHAECYAMIYLVGGCEGSVALNQGAKVYIAGRTTKDALSRITGQGNVLLEESDLPLGVHDIGNLKVTVGKPVDLSKNTGKSVAPPSPYGKSARQQEKEALADVADVPAFDMQAGGDAKKRYFLVGTVDPNNPPAPGYALLIVLPGGEGSADFNPFIRRIYKNALSKNWLIAQAVAPKWDEEQWN